MDPVASSAEQGTSSQTGSPPSSVRDTTQLIKDRIASRFQKLSGKQTPSKSAVNPEEVIVQTPDSSQAIVTRQPPMTSTPIRAQQPSQRASSPPMTSVVFVNNDQSPSYYEEATVHQPGRLSPTHGAPTPPSERSWTPSAVRQKIQNHPGWTNIKWFCAAICFLILVHGALCTGYMTAVLTTIEKRFELRSKTAGLIISSYEFGSLLSVLFVSYYGSRGHIPRFIAFGSLLLATGSILFSVPHFIANPLTLSNDTLQRAIKVGRMPDMCTMNQSQSHTAAHTNLTAEQLCVAEHESASQYVFILMLAQVLLGIGGSPIFTLGTTYIDNHVTAENSSVYLACMYVMVAFGPVCGFLLGALTLSKFIAPPEPVNLPDSAVVGLWWAGFILLGILYLIAALPFFGFPKHLPQSQAAAADGATVQTTTSQSQVGKNSLPYNSFGSAAGTAGSASSFRNNPNLDAALHNSDSFAYQQHRATPTSSEDTTAHNSLTLNADGTMNALKRIPLSVFRLLTNSVYMIASLNACMDLAIVSGFTTYLPKYLETQFGFTKSDASILTGGVAVPGAIVGIFLGSWLMKRYNLQLRHISVLVLSFNFATLCLLTLFFWFGCPNVDMAGIFSTYNEIEPLPNPLLKSQVQLVNHCNDDCSCSPFNFEPLCGIDGKTYFSPCHAGCTHVDPETVDRESVAGKVQRSILKYTSCKCIANATHAARSAVDASQKSIYVQTSYGAQAMSLTGSVVAQLGECQDSCKMIVPFMLLLFVLTLVASSNQMPLIMVTLRAVAEEEKAFALGLQVVMLRLVAYIPAPIIFGAIIDTTCLVWRRDDCGEVGTTCLLYDIEQFRLRYGLVVLLYKICAATLSVLLWWCITRRGKGAEPFSPPITMSEIAHRLGEMDNLHLNGCHTAPLGGIRSWVSDDSLYSRSRSPKRQTKCHQKTLSC